MFFPYGIDAALNWLDPVNREHPLNAGRVAWWLARPEGMGGPTWRDLMGSNAGMLTNMGAGSGWQGTTRPGGYGQVGFLASLTSQVRIPASAAIELSATGTAAVWCKPNGASQTIFTTILQKQQDSSSGGPYTIDLSSSGANFRGYLWNAGAYDPIIDPAGIVADTWYRLLLTWDGSTVALYKNGQPIGTTPQTTPAETGTGVLVIGGSLNVVSSAGPSFDGAIDDVSLWTRGLSASEARADYEESSRGYPGALNRVGPSAILLASSAAGSSAATFASTLGGVSLSSSAMFSDPGAFSAALAGVSLAASGLFATPSAFASTLAGASLTAAANAAPPGNTAAFAATLAGVGLASSATFASASTFHATLGGVSLVATAGVGAVNVDASFAATLGGVTLAAAAIYGQVYFEQALTLRLKANASILATAGGRVFPGMIPQNALLPAVTYLMHSKHRVANLDGKAGIARARVFISAWAHNYADAKSLANGIVADIPIGFTGQLGPGVIITDTFHRSEIDKYHEPSDSSDIGTFQTIFDIRMDYRE